MLKLLIHPFASGLAFLKSRYAPEPFLVLFIAINLVVFFFALFVDPLTMQFGAYKKVGDFVLFWSGAREALAGHPENIYDHGLMRARQVAELGKDFPGMLPWVMPPTFLFFVIPFGLPGYLTGYVVWVLVTATLYGMMAWCVLPSRKALLSALAMPSLLFCATYGQTGALSAALIGGMLAFLPKRPIMAGIFLGLLAYKPQLGLLFPLALAAGGYWRTFLSATLTIVFLTLASLWAFGWETWRPFLFENLQIYQGTLDAQAGFYRIQTIFGIARMVSGSSTIAGILQAITALITAAAVIVVWRKPFPFEMKGAVLILGVFAATPYLQIYEFPILTVAILLLAKLGGRDGYLPGELELLFLASIIPYFSLLPFPVGLLSVSIVAICIWQRMKRILSSRDFSGDPVRATV